ncbi:MAG TPA: formylglycine-generating enzyme family protein, partial [Candidatus Cloacimonadota bacterium]|nr:formylglycine-generating enzyme family protein [Candidatus Cloacimonadota bacterium]
SSSLLYTHPISCNTTQTIKAIALHPDYKQSNVVTASFTINMIIPENMAFVSGGTFSPNEGSYMVTLSSYFIGKYEVTQAEWESVMTGNTNGISATPSYFSNHPTHPVECVSWYDILVYCNRRSILEGLTPCYAKDGDTNPDHWGFVPTQANTYWNAITMNMSADGYRLPTEMEWEFAARGGNQSQNFTYSGSNTIEYVAWLYDNSSNMTQAVGSKAPNELGIFDMSGNVFEWCWDWIATYPSGSYTNPTTTISPYYRTKRGGSWDVDESYCQVSNRCDGNIDDRYSNNGFRVVRRIQ